MVIDKYNGTVDGANNLFASLLRSAGIPIRFVHGTIIYPDTLRGVYHLWTEVYFPSYGWVPFDVALNQIGYVDYYHVKWAESDSAELLSSLCGNYFYWYSKSGYNMNRDCYVYSEFESIPDKNDFNIQIDAKLLENIISEDSYNLMRIDIKNPDNFYNDQGIFSRSFFLLVQKAGAEACLKILVFWEIENQQPQERHPFL